MPWLNLAQIEDLCGVTYRTVKKRLEAAKVKSRKVGNAYEYPARDALMAVLAPDMTAGSDEDTAQAEQARYKAEKLRLEVEKIKGDITPKAEVITWAADVIGRSRSKLLALPGRVGAEVPPKLRPQVVKTSDRIVREALEELAALEWEDESE